MVCSGSPPFVVAMDPRPSARLCLPMVACLPCLLGVDIAAPMLRLLPLSPRRTIALITWRMLSFRSIAAAVVVPFSLTSSCTFWSMKLMAMMSLLVAEPRSRAIPSNNSGRSMVPDPSASRVSKRFIVSSSATSKSLKISTTFGLELAAWTTAGVSSKFAASSRSSSRLAMLLRFRPPPSMFATTSKISPTSAAILSAKNWWSRSRCRFMSCSFVFAFAKTFSMKIATITLKRPKLIRRSKTQ
mmetsp:Transcript_70760/g.154280  ORF Transcript_70760/g.154280 Transcript_70760/m.154280 type:complete len:243 (-) Transcript_70760:291-1019(-)